MNIHLMPDDTFVDEFIDYSNKIEGVSNSYWVDSLYNETKIVKKYSQIVDLSQASDSQIDELKVADKIFIHYLTDNVINLLSESTFKEKKIFWIIWGSDLYQWLSFDLLDTFDFLKSSRFSFPLNLGHLVYNRIRVRYDAYIKSRRKFTKLLNNLSGLLHYNKFDIDLLNNQFKVNIPFVPFFYKNLIDWKDLDKALDNHSNKKETGKVKLLIGNSATSTNNHFSIFKQLSGSEFFNYHLFVPLSYGDKKYGNVVEEYGYKVLGERFHSINNYMSPKEYTEMLLDLDGGIMNHNRSQGFGNIIVLLYLGKLVYLNPTCTTFYFLKSLNFKIFSTNEIKAAAMLMENPLSEADKEFNRVAIKEFFSDENFLENLHRVYFGH